MRFQSLAATVFVSSIFSIGCSSSGVGGGGAASCADGGTCPSGFVCGANGVCEPVAGTGGSGATTGSGGFGNFGGNAGASGSGTGGFGGFGAVGGNSGSAGVAGFSGSSGSSGSGGSAGATGFCGDNIKNGTEDCDTNGDSVSCDKDCTFVACADGYHNKVAEPCDDGFETATCNVDCTLAKCGDNKINKAAGEECDDGGTTSGDGCSSTCKTELSGVGEDCSSAIPLKLGSNSLSWTASINNYLKTTPACVSTGSTTGPDVVFSYTAASTGSLKYTIGKPTSTRWVATTSAGTCGNGAVQTSCVSDYSASSMVTTVNVTAGTTYYLYLVDNTSGSNPLSNPVSINLALTPTATGTGEDCSSVIPLQLGANTINWTATKKDYVPTTNSCSSTYSSTGPDVVMSYTPSLSGTVSYTIAKPSSTRWVALVENGSCGFGLSSPLSCTSAYSGTSMSGSFSATGGTTYYFYIADTTSGSNPLSNPFTITLN